MDIKSNRIPWIDTAKGLGLLCVIFGHLGVPYLSTWLYTFHMPLFFFLSGVVFSGGKYTFSEFLVRKLKSLVVPYFVLGGGIFLVHCLINLVQGAPGITYHEMLINFMVQEHFWTVWFLACLFLVEVLYYCIYKVLVGRKVLLTIVSLLLCGFGLLRYRLGWGSLPWNLDVAFVAQFFFHCGFLLKGTSALEKTEKMKLPGKIVGALSALLVNAATGFLCIRVSGQSLDMSIGMYGSEVLTFVSAISGIFAIVLISQMFSQKWITYLGQNTMVIFGWHSRIVIVLCGYLYAYFGIFQGGGLISQLMYAAVTFVIILGILIPATVGIKRSRIHAVFGL